MPGVLPENENVLKVYQMVRQQYIMGFSGPVDIDVKAVDIVIDRYCIKEKDCFDRVVNICRHMLNKRSNEQKNNSTNSTKKNNNKSKTFK